MIYDVIIIGAGPGGYVAAERAGKRNLKTLLIEKEQLGGVCLNSGCIPTKTLLNGAKLYSACVRKNSFGVSVEGASYDFKAAMIWKNEVIDKLRRGVASQMKRYGVDMLSASAELVSQNEVLADSVVYRAENIIIATGSSAALAPVPGIEASNVMTNREILSLEHLPKRLAIIGGGIIGIEFASYFSMVGVDVTVIEAQQEILPSIEPELSRELRKSMKDTTFHLSSKVTRVHSDALYFLGSDARELRCECDLVLCACGRKPNTQHLGLAAAGVLSADSFILVDGHMRTNVPGIYAIGDVNGLSLYAHSASRMAEVAVDSICGISQNMSFDSIPSVLYSFPEIASCGYSEAAARQAGYTVKTASLPMRVNGRFYAENGKVPGLCKVVIDADNGFILGVHLFGSNCSEMITAASVMIKTKMRVKDVCDCVFAHPTVSEIIRDTLAECL